MNLMEGLTVSTLSFSSTSKTNSFTTITRPNLFIASSSFNPNQQDDNPKIKQNGAAALNLVRRPVPKKGIKFNTPESSSSSAPQQVVQRPDVVNKGAPKVALRKPLSAYPEDDDIEDESKRLRLKSNLLLKMRRNDNVSDITLLEKPHSVAPKSPALEPKPCPDLPTAASEHSFPQVSQLGGDESTIIMNTIDAALKGKPQRLDQSLAQGYNPSAVGAEPPTTTDNTYYTRLRTENFTPTAAAPLQECEEADWTRAEDLFTTGEREEVELISCSSRGFVGSFGSLIGFLPYRNLGAKWKFLAFESWVIQKGFDPSIYRQNVGLIGGYEVQRKNRPIDSNPIPESKDIPLDSDSIPERIDGKLASNVTLEDLLKLYDQEKTKFLSSFVGQKIKVNVVLADRNSRRLMFSGRKKQNEELVEKKRSLMAKLSVGDVVKCSIKKITYFGIFVEVEGIPALIHQSEVSWDATLDPSSFLKIGQIVDAKVHQLDFTLERIQLSLKEITPDPLIEALESVVGGGHSLDGTLQAAQEDVEWNDVESLIQQLQQIEDIQSVSKGRFFLSPGLAPTFQVYMASMFENRYKLLARSGKKVQEVIVQASLDKEQMKVAILTCTNRVG